MATIGIYDFTNTCIETDSLTFDQINGWMNQYADGGVNATTVVNNVKTGRRVMISTSQIVRVHEFADED